MKDLKRDLHQQTSSRDKCVWQEFNWFHHVNKNYGNSKRTKAPIQTDCNLNVKFDNFCLTWRHQCLNKTKIQEVCWADAEQKEMLFWTRAGKCTKYIPESYMSKSDKNTWEHVLRLISWTFPGQFLTISHLTLTITCEGLKWRMKPCTETNRNKQSWQISPQAKPEQIPELLCDICGYCRRTNNRRMSAQVGEHNWKSKSLKPNNLAGNTNLQTEDEVSVQLDTSVERGLSFQDSSCSTHC